MSVIAYPYIQSSDSVIVLIMLGHHTLEELVRFSSVDAQLCRGLWCLSTADVEPYIQVVCSSIGESIMAGAHQSCRHGIAEQRLGKSCQCPLARVLYV